MIISLKPKTIYLPMIRIYDFYIVPSGDCYDTNHSRLASIMPGISVSRSCCVYLDSWTAVSHTCDTEYITAGALLLHERTYDTSTNVCQ